MGKIENPQVLCCPVCNSSDVDLLDSLIWDNIEEHNYICCECRCNFQAKSILTEISWEE